MILKESLEGTLGTEIFIFSSKAKLTSNNRDNKKNTTVMCLLAIHLGNQLFLKVSVSVGESKCNKLRLSKTAWTSAAVEQHRASSKPF